jgi:universal stress protein E
MKMLGKILLPTDLRGSAQDAIDMAITLAKKFDTEIILLHVLPEFTKSKSVLDIHSKNVHYQLSAVQDYMLKNGVKIADPIISIGHSFHHIVELAKKRDVNLILMGSGEKGRGDKYKLGNITENVIRASDIPVWVVKSDTPADIQHVICPLDFSEPSKRALTNAIHIARTFKADLTLLTVIHPIGDSFLGIKNHLEEEHRKNTEKHVLEFEEFLSEFDFYGIEYVKKIVEGNPEEEILKIITYPTYKLLIMGTTGKSGLAKILIGSVTEKVVREVPCSFVTLKTKDVIRLKIEADIDDISHHFNEGEQLLKKGFPEAALDQFQSCIAINNMYLPAWDAVTETLDRLGRTVEANVSHSQSKKIKDRLYDPQK